jgi:hypothetical protein
MEKNKTKQVDFLEAYPLIHGAYYYYDITFYFIRKEES